MLHLKNPKTIKYIIIVSIHFFMLSGYKGKAQQIEDIKEKVNAKIHSIIDTLSSTQVYIAGRINTQFQATYGPTTFPAYDYSMNVNLELTYKGIRIPLQYIYSNGRSIYRFQGPSFRTPSFKKFGLSPSYKGYQLHIGNRLMDFSKYSYQQVRFEGFGFQTPEKGLYCKFFRGTLSYVAPSDLFFNSAVNPPYKRRAWGTLLGYSGQKAAFKLILFKAGDELDSLNQDSNNALPKENTVIGTSLLYNPQEKISFRFEQAISAYTNDARSPRIDILTPQTAHNMLGLFERKTSSMYALAIAGEVLYTIGKHKLGYLFETVDKDYHSLGSLFYDNNFIDHRLSISGVLQDKLTYSLSGGLRKSKVIQDTLPSHGKFIIQSSLTYQFSEGFSVFSSFNNFKNVQHEYYRSYQSNAVDSFSLSQVNTALTLGSNYQVKTKSPIQLTALMSLQYSNGITNDVVSNNDSENRLFSLGYNQQVNSSTWQGTISYSSTKSMSYKNRTWSIGALYGKTISDKLRLSNNLQFQSILFTPSLIHQVISRTSLDIEITDRLFGRIEVGLEITDSNHSFRVERLLFRIDSSYKF